MTNDDVKPRQRLFTPGPTPVPDAVYEAMNKPLVYHRGPDFPELLRTTVEGLQSVFPTGDDIFLLSASGTGAMEAAVVNVLSRGDRVLVAQAGQFGARWRDICESFGAQVTSFDGDWGTSLDAEAIADALGRDDGLRAVFVTQSETSTGALHDIEAIAAAVRKTDALLIVDGVSSVGAHALPTDKWGCDVAVTASQKGLMTPPGVAVITVSDRAWKAVERSDLPKLYWDLRAIRKAMDEGRGAATLPVTLISGLKAAVGMMMDEGMEQVWARHARHANAIRASAAALGLHLFAQTPSNALTSIRLPELVDGVGLMETLRVEAGVVTGGGLGGFRGRLLRISNLGFFDDLDMVTAVAALEMGLRRHGHSFDPGAGVAAAQGILERV